MNNIIGPLVEVVGAEYVLWSEADLLVYEYDGSVDRSIPLIVVLPETTEQVSQIVKIARQNSLPVVARGAGTGLSGGAIAEHGGVVIAMSRMTRILEVNEHDRYAVVQPGVVNLDLSNHVGPSGLY